MEVTNQPVPYLPKASETDKAVPKQAALTEEKIFQDADKPITKEMLSDKVSEMNEFLEPNSTNIKFQLHEQLEVYYVQVIDSKTDEVLREIPNRKFLDMYASMAEIAGIIVDEKR